VNGSQILAVYLKELKDSLRDRRTLVSMIVVPTLVMPLLLVGVSGLMGRVLRQARQEASPIVILGGADSPGIVAALKADPKFRVVPEAGDYRRMISDKRIRAAVEIPPGFQRALQNGEPRTVVIYHYENELKSSLGLGEIERFFRALRERTIQARLAERGLPESLVQPFALRRRNVAPPEKVGGNLVGGIVPYIIILLCFTGAMYPAIDLTAGEKERGTMETLLCSPVGRINLVLGKFLMVLTASVTTMLLSLVSMGVSATLGIASLAPGDAAAGGVVPRIDPLGLVGVFAMIAPVAVLFAAGLLTLSLFAKSYKEAQSYVSPLVLVVVLPAVIGMLPGIELGFGTAFVPILNLSLVCKEMLSGVWHWGLIAVIFASSCLYAGAALALAVRMFNREEVLFRS
jgi:sodium transport system permease protein